MNVRLMIQKTKTDKSGMCPIYVEISINPKDGKKDTKRIPTGEKVHAKYWSKNREVSSSYAGYKDINNAILKKKLEVQQLIRENAQATPAEIKHIAEKRHVVKTPSMLELYDDFAQYKASVLTENGMKAINALHGLLKSYVEKGNKLSIKELGFKFYDSFYAFAIAQNLAKNTVARRFETFKTFLNYLTDRGINNNTDYKKWKLPKITPTKMTTLSKSEVQQLYDLEIDSPKLAKVRDLFIILCTTGLRFTDGKKLKQHDIDVDKKTILIRADKTQDIITIPLSKLPLSILKKYDYDLTSLTISNQKFNDYIKDVCELAGIKGKVVINKKGSNSQTVVKEKWECISSHTGRRTFATIALEIGMRPDVIMKITGHKDHRSFKKYIDHTSVLTASEMAKWDS